MDESYEALQKELQSILERKDVAAVKQFLIDHLKEFPQSVQDEIVMAFVEEASAVQKNIMEEWVAWAREGLAAIADIDKTEKALRHKAALLDIRDSIK